MASSLGKKDKCLQEVVRVDSDHHSAELQALMLKSVRKIDNWTTKAKALEVFRKQFSLFGYIF